LDFLSVTTCNRKSANLQSRAFFNRHYLQLTDAPTDISYNSTCNQPGQTCNHRRQTDIYLQLKQSPKTHLSMLNLDVVFWTVFLDTGKPRQTLSGLRLAQRPTNGGFLHRPKPRFQLQIIPVRTRRLPVRRVRLPVQLQIIPV
jgi:hypothetical protein